MSNKKDLFYIRNINVFKILIYISIINISNASEVQNHFLIIPFKTYYPKIEESKSTQEKILNSWLRQKIYLSFENSSNQKLSMILTLEQIEAHSKEDIALLRSEEKYIKLYTTNLNDICFFQLSNSPNYKCLSNTNIYVGGRDKGCVTEEKLKFYKNEKLSEGELLPFKFIHTTNITNICLFGSLQRYLNSVDKTKSFIDQLKVLSGAKTYTWMLKYTSSDEGIFIFGDIINNTEISFTGQNNNIEKNYEPLYSTSADISSRIFWKFRIDKLFFGNLIIGGDFSLNIEIDTPFILMKKDYFNIIKEEIFKDYISDNICKVISVEYRFNCIYCNKNQFLKKSENMQKIPSLSFQIKKNDLNITFTSNDLFKVVGDDIYFLIARSDNDDCTLGAILLKKYPSIFDLDSKQLKIMKLENDEMITESNKGKIIFIIILTMVLSGLIFGFVGLKYGKKIYQPRKQKIYELDNNYEYTKNMDINQDKRIIYNENKNYSFYGPNNIILEMTKK